MYSVNQIIFILTTCLSIRIYILPIELFLYDSTPARWSISCQYHGATVILFEQPSPNYHRSSLTMENRVLNRRKSKLALPNIYQTIL